MKNKIASLKATLSTQSDQINKKYSEGVVDGFTNEPLELLMRHFRLHPESITASLHGFLGLLI